jgi:hypothetical protein
MVQSSALLHADKGGTQGSCQGPGHPPDAVAEPASPLSSGTPASCANQVLLNLFSNAVKRGDRGPIELSASGDYMIRYGSGECAGIELALSREHAQLFGGTSRLVVPVDQVACSSSAD